MYDKHTITYSGLWWHSNKKGEAVNEISLFCDQKAIPKTIKRLKDQRNSPYVEASTPNIQNSNKSNWYERGHEIHLSIEPYDSYTIFNIVSALNRRHYIVMRIRMHTIQNTEYRILRCFGIRYSMYVSVFAICNMHGNKMHALRMQAWTNNG